jgi:hypothetical protein
MRARRQSTLGLAVLILLTVARTGGTTATAAAITATTEPAGVPRIGCAELNKRIPDPPTYQVPTTQPNAASPSHASVVQAAPVAPASAPKNSSETNVQVAGVDEPDLVETDGRFLYSSARSDLRVIDLRTRREVVALTFPWNPAGVPDWERADDQLLLLDRDLVVIAPFESSDESHLGTAMKSVDSGDRVWVAVYDVGNPRAPKLRQHFMLSGSLFVARAANGKVLFVTTNRLAAGASKYVYPNDPTSPVYVNAANRYNQAVRADLTNFLPTALIDGRKVSVGCDAVLAPEGTKDSGDLAALYRLDLGAKVYEPIPLVTTLSNSPAWGSAGYTNAETFTLPTEVASSDATLLLRFDWATDGRLVARGRVPGKLLDQFAMDEHGGTLRLATTTRSAQANGTRTQESGVYTFRQNGDLLTEIGRVEGLGQTEEIKSARFLGDYGYVVTFRQTDPLYSIDLRNPAQPRVAGELKVAGYSDYLQSIGRGLLIGIGQDADEETGRVQGSKAALFDVSNPTRPKQIGSTRIAERPKGFGAAESWEVTESEAEYDWHAFLWWSTGPTTGKAVLPVYGYGQSADGSWFLASEVAVLKVRNKTLRRQATIRHPVADCEDGWSSPIRRSLVINGELVTVSRSGVKVNNLNTVKPLGWVPTN